MVVGHKRGQRQNNLLILPSPPGEMGDPRGHREPLWVTGWQTSADIVTLCANSPRIIPLWEYFFSFLRLLPRFRSAPVLQISSEWNWDKPTRLYCLWLIWLVPVCGEVLLHVSCISLPGLPGLTNGWTCLPFCGLEQRPVMATSGISNEDVWWRA